MPLGGGPSTTLAEGFEHADALVGAGPGKLLLLAGSGNDRSVRLLDTASGMTRVLGPAVTTLSGGVASDGRTADWVYGSSLYSAPIAGGEATQISMTGHLTALALRGKTRFVHDSTRKQVVAVDASGSASDLGSTDNCRFVDAIAVDDGSVYWGCPSKGNLEHGTLERAGRSGGPITRVLEGVAEVSSLAIDDTHLYALESTAPWRLLRIDKVTGLSVVLARPAMPDQCPGAGIALSNGTVYYLSNTLRAFAYGEGHLSSVTSR